MEQQTECEPTTSDNTLNTSQAQNAQQGSDPPISEKLMISEQSTDHVGDTSSRYFTLLDLCRLTFSLDGIEVLNALDATSEQFSALAALVADVTNVGQWYIEDRRDFINGLYTFCEERGFTFPFTFEDEEEKIATEPLEEEGHSDAK